MATVTVMTAERMQEIEDQAVIGAEIVGGHVIFERHNGTTFDGGAIDVSVIGQLALGVDEEIYTRITDAGPPLTLVPDAPTVVPGSLLDDETPVTWGEWDTADTDTLFIVNESGFYDIYAFADFEVLSSDAGRANLFIDTSTGQSTQAEFKHEDTETPHLETQITTLLPAGSFICLDVKSSNPDDVVQASLIIRKLDIDITGEAESGSGGSASQIYSITDNETLASDTGLSLDLNFELLVRATINIQMTWRYDGTMGAGSFRWFINGEDVEHPAPFTSDNASNSHLEHINTGTTLDAGEHSITAEFVGGGGDGGSSGGPCRIDIVVIVGSNTEDDSVVFFGDG